MFWRCYEADKGKNIAVRFDARGSLLERSGEIIPGGKIELTLDNARGLTIWDMMGIATMFSGGTSACIL